MVTQSQKMDSHLNTIGKRVRWPATDAEARETGKHVEIACMASGKWEVRAQWITDETMDSDPQSINCGCPFAGRNHAETRRVAETLTEAWELFGEAKTAASAGRCVTCLGQIRVV